MSSASSSYSLPRSLPDTLLMKSVRNSGFNADFFFSAFGDPQQALILLGGSEGGNNWSNQTVYIKQLVGLGYAVLSLAYFGAAGLPPHLRAIPVEYITKAISWLSAQKEVHPDKFVLLGVSRGAELALLASSIYDEIKAVVAIAPSSVIFPGPPIGILDVLHGQHSAWSFNGHEVAFLPLSYSWTTLHGMVTGRRTRMFEKALLNTEAVEAAAIPVEKIKGPILLESFIQDQIWPSTAMANQIVGRLTEKGFRYFFKHTPHATTHSNWSFGPCWSNILSFLRNVAKLDFERL